MFYRRLKVFLILLLVPVSVVVARLTQLQVSQADYYQEVADNALIRQPRYIPAVRGRILDRYGKVLATDEPTWDVCVHYGALSRDDEYLRKRVSEWRRQGRLPADPNLDRKEQNQIDEAAIARNIEESLREVAELTGRSLDEIARQRETILDRVASVQKALLKKRGYLVPPEETQMNHPLVRGIDDQTAVKARLALTPYDWLSVQASTRRHYDPRAASMGHLMGRLAQVTAEVKDRDPYRDDRTRCYLPWESFGVAGVERLCEPILRGQRGVVETDIDGEEIGQTKPVDGRDAVLTIDIDLQQKVYEAVGKGVTAPSKSATGVVSPSKSTGGAAVVIHIPTRQVLALVSYPSFNPNDFTRDFARMIDDTRNRPTLFRAVAAVYPPGSVAKPATLATGLALKVITPETRLHCHGYLNKPDGRFQCWIYRQHYPHTHDERYPNGLNAEEALQESCNCYFYQLGELIRGDRLCQWFRQFWVGPPASPGMIAGTGLIEEREGILPTAAWLWEKRHRPMTLGDSRNYAIGQGEVGLTPLQVANLMATIASGQFMWPTVVANDGRERPAWVLPLTSYQWKTVRRGLYRVVNNPHGTAYGHARMDEIALAGKTGSAQCTPVVIDRQYLVEWPDGRREKIIAKQRLEVEKQIEKAPGAKIISSRPHKLFPETTDSLAHAWFAGFVPAGPGEEPEFAIAVLIEFGESGGLRAAPVAKEIIRAMIESPHKYLHARTQAEVEED
jgi:penicillin-binding protein 2